MADFNSLKPEEQKRVMDVIARQFSNGTKVNQSRAREAMNSNPQYARAMMGRAGIGPADNNDAGDAVGSAIQMAITNSLRDSGGEAPAEAKAAPTAGSGKSSGARKMKPMQRSANSSEGGREARADRAEADREANRGKGFSKIANGDSESAGDDSTDLTALGVGGGAAGMYALYRMMKGKKPMQMPAEANQPALDGPGARRGALVPIEDAQYTTIDEVAGPRSDAPQITEQRKLPAPQRMITDTPPEFADGIEPRMPMVDAGAYEPSPQDLEVMQSILMRGPQGMTSNPNTPPWAVDAGAPSVNPRAPNMRDTISKGLRKQLYGVGRF